MEADKRTTEYEAPQVVDLGTLTELTATANVNNPNESPSVKSL